ncbi:Allantoate permease [Candidozyma auris]
MSEKLTSTVSVAPTDVESQRNEITTVISPHTGKPIHISTTGDAAMDYVLSHNDEKVELDPETDRKLLWKIDLYLLPLICLLYAVQFMDKMSNSYAAVMGLREDLDMHGDRYSWTGSAFYLGYLAFEFPCAYTLQRFPVITTVSIYIVIWGIILMLHAVPNSRK